MGQYHYICNMDKKEYLDPHAFGDGLKLMEFGWSSRGTLTALAVLLSEQNGRGGGDAHEAADTPTSGRWVGDRIAIVGDYFDGEKDAVGGADNPWKSDGYDEWNDISQAVIATLPTELRAGSDVIDGSGSVVGAKGLAAGTASLEEEVV